MQGYYELRQTWILTLSVRFSIYKSFTNLQLDCLVYVFDSRLRDCLWFPLRQIEEQDLFWTSTDYPVVDISCLSWAIHECNPCRMCDHLGSSQDLQTLHGLEDNSLFKKKSTDFTCIALLLIQVSQNRMVKVRFCCTLHAYRAQNAAPWTISVNPVNERSRGYKILPSFAQTLFRYIFFCAVIIYIWI